MSEIKIPKLPLDKANERLVTEALKAGDKVILRFVHDEHKAEFMSEMARIGALGGAGLGLIGGALGGAEVGAEVGSLAGLPGAIAGVLIGGTAGFLGGTLVGYSAGALSARSIYNAAGRDGKIYVKDLPNLLGFGRGRVQIALVYA